MARSSGFLIDWDERSKAGTVLTSARIICSKYSALSQWSGTDEYAPNAEVSSQTNEFWNFGVYACPCIFVLTSVLNAHLCYLLFPSLDCCSFIG